MVKKSKKELQLVLSPKVLIARDTTRFVGVDKYSPPENFRHGSDLHCCFSLIALFRMGFKDAGAPGVHIRNGVACWHHYFCEDWWFQVDEWSINPIDKNCVDGPSWFEIFSRGLLLGTLSEEWNTVKSVCRWVDAALTAEYLGDEFDDSLPLFYKVIAQHFAESPMPGLAELLDNDLESASVRVQLLVDAFNAIEKNDAEQLKQLLERSAKLFRIDSRPLPTNLVLIEESILLNLAYKQGLGNIRIDLPDHLLLLTYDSLSLK